MKPLISLILFISANAFANSQLYYSYQESQVYADPIKSVDQLVMKDGSIALQVNADHLDYKFDQFPVLITNRTFVKCKITEAELHKLEYTIREFTDLIFGSHIDLSCLNIDSDGLPGTVKISLKVP